MAEIPHVCAATAIHLALAPRECSRYPPVASVSLLQELAVDCVVSATASNHSPLPGARPFIDYRNQSKHEEKPH